MLPTPGGVGLIPGWRTEIPHAMWPKKKNKKKTTLKKECILCYVNFTSKKQNALLKKDRYKVIMLDQTLKQQF